MNPRPGCDRDLDLTSTGPTTGAARHDRASAFDLPPGRLEEFHLVDFIGAGAMGEVYLYQDARRRPVAVKLARQPGMAHHRHFLREARAAVCVRHPNVLAVHRIGRLAGRSYLVSEYLPGPDLRALAPLPWQQALALGIDLARGLAAAHRRGIVHRDIKPANVVRAGTGEAKLIDFGLARWVDEDEPEPPGRGHAAGLRTPAGTPSYMAPELWRGARATPRSDVYSFGVLLHELCTGCAPPRAAEPTAPPAPRLDEACPGVDPRFAAVVHRCLARAPADRFASAEALCHALEAIAHALSAPIAAAGRCGHARRPAAGAHPRSPPRTT